MDEQALDAHDIKNRVRAVAEFADAPIGLQHFARAVYEELERAEAERDAARRERDDVLKLTSRTVRRYRAEVARLTAPRAENKSDG